MQHPDRDSHESAFAAKLRGLSASLRRELAGYVGSPPNFANVPASFWQRAEEEYRAEIIAALYLIHLENEFWHANEAGFDDFGGGLSTGFDRAAEAYANGRGAAVAGGAMQKARERWDAKQAELEARRQRGEDVSAQEVADAIESSLPDSQADNIARTETTTAQTQGGESGTSMTAGISGEDTWSVRPELSRSGPCDNCRALDGVPRSQWGLIQLGQDPADGHQGDPTTGPPLGPGCCCEIIYAQVNPRP